jgi:hypothetical protein
MIARHTRSRLSVLALLCLPQVLNAGEEPPPEPPSARSTTPVSAPPAWTQLRFAADSLTGSVHTTLTLAPASPAELDIPPYAALRDTPEAFTGGDLLRLQVDGEIRGLFGDSETRASVWFDASSGQVLLRERIRPGSEGSGKIHRFGSQGASRLRLEPADSREAQQPVAQWTRRDRKFHRYDLRAGGCSRIIVPALLMYEISRQPVTARHCVFHDDALYRVTLEARDPHRQPVSYTLAIAGTERSISGSRPLQVYALRIEPLGSEADIEKFELLELRGALRIHVDPEFSVPVQVSGSRRGAGRITIGLTGATLAAESGDPATRDRNAP